MSSMKSLGKQIARGFDSRQLHKLRQSSLTRRDSTVVEEMIYQPGFRGQPVELRNIPAGSAYNLTSSRTGLIGFDSLLVGMTEDLFAINGKSIQLFNQPLRMVA